MNTPQFRVISVGDEDWVSHYRSSIVRRGQSLSEIEVVTRAFNADSQYNDIESYIKESNENILVAGILGLTPVSQKLLGTWVYDHIAHQKDVDCQTKWNFEAFMRWNKVPFAPATAEAVKFLINNAPIDHNDGINVAIVWAWNAVWKPLWELYRRIGIPHEVIETHPDFNPHWREQLTDSQANVLVWATRGAHCITSDILPENTQLLVDVAYCELQGTNKMVGNMCPEIIDIPKITSGKVWKTTTEIIFQHVLSNIK